MKWSYLPVILVLASLEAQTSRRPQPSMPQVVAHEGRFELLVDGAPYLMLGAQINNSSAWLASMPQVWPTLGALNVNTVEAPVYWEALEPAPNRFSYDQVDALIDGARQHEVRLVLLWFATWKNGSGHYIPQWMKEDETRFLHIHSQQGMPVGSLSPHAPATLAADIHAFVALMRHLRIKDPQHTVIMVQVENEPGTWGAKRDYSPAAEALFAGRVPAEIAYAMGKPTGQPWSATFGDEADGIFHAYAVARYIDQVAAAGKAELALPMYVNAALRDPLHPGKQGSWESGGATDDVLPLWKAAAPHIDLLAPDIYSSDYARYTRLLELYGTATNPLLVPETGRSPAFARFCFATIGHGGLGWAPFGMDATSDFNAPADNALGATALDLAHLQQFAYNFAVLRPIDHLLAGLQFQGKVKGVAEDDAAGPHKDRMQVGAWTAVVTYGRPHFGNAPGPGGNQPAKGEALVAQLGENDFLVAAYQARVDFEPGGANSGKHMQFLAVEEGTYRNGVWVASRIWNGDQTDYGLNFGSSAKLLRVRLSTY